MNIATQQILDTALQLPESDRAELAASLFESLDNQPFDDDAQAAWAEEIGHRLAEYETGSVVSIPWEEARHKIAGHAP